MSETTVEQISTVNYHGVVAPHWMLAAAKEGRMGAAILPLIGGWVEGDNTLDAKDLKTGFNKGDRIYLQEPWIFHSQTQSVRAKSSFSPEVDDFVEWVPAAFMGEDISQYHFEITDVVVVQIEKLSLQQIAQSAIPQAAPGITLNTEDIKIVWDTAHPMYLWKSNPLVVVLSISPCAKEDCYE